LDKALIPEFVDLNLSEFSKYLQPRNYILENPSRVDREMLVRYLQNMVRAALVYFVNGCYWCAFTGQDLLFPFYSKIGNRIKHIFLEIYPIIETASLRFNYFSEFYSKLKGVNRRVFVSEEEIAELFSIFYREFESVLPALKFENEATNDICPELKIEDYPVNELHYLKPLGALKTYAQNYLQEYLVGLYLHGSLSTMDYIPYWSDVDTLMILKKETIRAPKKLVELRRHAITSHKYFYQIDPHQFHGHLLISEFDFEYYPQTYFPLVLFKYSKSFFNNDQPLAFKLREYKSERIATFWSDAVSYFLHVGLRPKQYGKYSMANRDRKLFFHRLLTFPLFYLQAKEIHVYKKYSFEEAKVDFEDALWKIVETATEARNQWTYRHRANSFLSFIFSANPKLFLLSANKYYDFKYRFVDDAFSDFDVNYERWLSQAIDLSVVAWNKIVKAEKLSKTHGC